MNHLISLKGRCMGANEVAEVTMLRVKVSVGES